MPATTKPRLAKSKNDSTKDAPESRSERRPDFVGHSSIVDLFGVVNRAKGEYFYYWNGFDRDRFLLGLDLADREIRESLGLTTGERRRTLIPIDMDSLEWVRLQDKYLYRLLERAYQLGVELAPEPKDYSMVFDGLLLPILQDRHEQLLGEQERIFGDALAENELIEVYAYLLEHWSKKAKLDTLSFPAEPCETPSGRRAKSTTEIAQHVNQFLEATSRATGKTVYRKHIWLVAGYLDRTEFERWQRGKPSNNGVAVRFKRVLSMTPADFMRSLDRKLLASK